MILRFGKLKSLLPDLDVDVEAVADALTLSGSAVDRVEREGDDAIIETDITTNRPDLLVVLDRNTGIGSTAGIME